MKFIIVGPVYPYRGGIAHYTAMLAQAFQQIGHACEIISFRRQYPAFLYPGKSDRDPSRDPIQTQASFMLDPILPWTWLRVYRAINLSRPNLVIFQWWTTFWAIPFALISWMCRRKNLPVCYLIHNVFPHEQHPWDTWLARLSLRQGKVFITQTTCEAEKLRQIIPGAEIQQHLHPHYSIFTAQRLSRPEARQKLGLPADAFVLLFFGIVRPYKGLQVLLQAIASLQNCNLAPFLLVAGEFWQEKRTIFQFIEDSRLSTQVQIVDRYILNEEVALYFSAADGFVAPYTAGTQSGAATIALAFGLPVILSDTIAQGISPEFRPLLHVVPAGDANALAVAIEDLMLHPPGVKPAAQTALDNWSHLAQTCVEIAQKLQAG